MVLARSIDRLSPQQYEPETGIYAAFYLSQHSARQLHTWCQQYNIPNLEPTSELHITTVYSRKPISYEGFGKLRVPYQLNCSDFRWKMLGQQQESLVLLVQSPMLLAAWTTAMSLGASWDFPNYQPHVTISNMAPGILDRQLSGELPLPKFHLYLSEERVSALKEP